ncbi:hypothetical protein LCGC14_0908690 [marine sediment metagenome]|uniref:Uncharacterized protein n=1 Tax=marine sediment metagenome TaxID=412755 RepID=A0A0F9NYX3_9ZZZZ
MAITGSVDLGKGKRAVTVDHDPRSVATDVPKGSLIIDANGDVFTKMDDGVTTHVNRAAPVVSFRTGGASSPYWETENGTYETVGAFVFVGSDYSCKPDTAKFVIETTGDAEADVRIQDVTNTQTIAELTGQTSSGPTVKTDSALANLPAGEAVFELQIKKSAGTGGNKARIYDVCLG